MQSQKNTTKDDVKITCIYHETGKHISEILRESFLLFLKSELMQLCDQY